MIPKFKNGFLAGACLCLLFLVLCVLQVFVLSNINWLLLVGCLLFYMFGSLFFQKIALIEAKRRTFARRKSAYDLDVQLNSVLLTRLIEKGGAVLLSQYGTFPNAQNAIQVKRIINSFSEDPYEYNRYYLVTKEKAQYVQNMFDRENKVYKTLKEDKEKFGV